MIPQLKREPKIWLDLGLCENIYSEFRKVEIFREPLKPFSTRFPGRLEAILGSVQQSFGGKYLYPTVSDAAAAYFVKINCLHPFENGNKRLCILYTDVFLFFHQLELKLSHKEMYDLALFVAMASTSKKWRDLDLFSFSKKVLIDHIGVKYPEKNASTKK